MNDENKVRVPRKKVYMLVLFLFLLMAGYWVYNFSMNRIDLGKQQALERDIATKNEEIQRAHSSPDYTTYNIGEKLIASQTNGSWLDRISRVIQIFTTLQSIGAGNVQFSDFKIDFDHISLRGMVPNLSYIYAKNGIIDQFVALDFIKNVAIQDYKKNGDIFAFTLTADISLHGTGNNQ